MIVKSPLLEDKEHPLDHIDWDTRFMILAQHLAGWSHLRGTKVGAVIVDIDNEVRALGVSGFPRGVDAAIDERYNRETGENRYWICHAEQNAIHSAARFGLPLRGCRLYSSMFPCADCARAIIQAGIVRVTSPPPDANDVKWDAHFKRSLPMFNEAGIAIKYWYASDDCAAELKRD